jgi:tetratricopeptide (TPR) repeat protein
MESYFLGFDPETLQERFDIEAAQLRLDALGIRRDLDATIEKIALLRIVGRIDDAQDAASGALRQARFEADRQQLAKVRVARAQVHRVARRFDQAGSELTDVIVEASSHGWSEVEADALHERALVHVALDRVAEARDDLNAALVILIRDHASAIEIDSTMIALGTLIERVSSPEGAGAEPSPADV